MLKRSRSEIGKRKVHVTIEIRPVTSRRDRERFVKTPHHIFRNDPFWVPPLMRDELETFDPQKNPAYDQAESFQFLAYQNGRPAGCVAAILSHAANQKYNARNLRFGWFDTVDDYAVAEALLGAVQNLAREKGLTSITGPMGFNDLDPEGLLVEGFENLVSVANRYHPPYYARFIERFGFQKEVDYLEFRFNRPNEAVSRQIDALGRRIKNQDKFRVLEFRNARKLAPLGPELFAIHNEAYAHLYGTVPLTERQMQYYAAKYIPLVNPAYSILLMDEADKMAGYFINIPNLSRAFQKARGRLFPLGWWYIWRALHAQEVVDCYIIGVKNEYRGHGAAVLMLAQFLENVRFTKHSHAETTHLLESNSEVQAMFKYIDSPTLRRRRIYKKVLA